jgi:Fe-S cluster biogenesis protein NfuA
MSEEITLNFEGRGDQTIRITARPSLMHPEQCVFEVNQPLFPENSAHFADREAAAGSELVERIFDLGNVGDVLVNHSTLRVTLGGDASWEDSIPLVGAIIRDALLSDEPAISEAVLERQLPPEELRRRVAQVLDTVINPAVAAHGGVVNLLDVVNNTVFLEFGGGCQGCGMINVTLKYGVERAIREEVPEVGEILDTTDHASGNNPYYAPSAK